MIRLSKHGADTNGFVLIAVLTVLTLLSAMVVVMLGMSRDSIDIAALSGIETKRQAMVQSGLSLAAYELFQLGLPPERVSGGQFRLNDGMIAFTVSTDTAKADLNASGKDLLAAAYMAAGLTTLSPQEFAARVIDWRDENDDISAGGAEGQDYVKLDYLPRNGRFRSVDDLRWVIGLFPEDIKALRRFVTVYNPRGRLNVFAAPASMIAALPKVAPETVDEVLQARSTRSATATDTLDDLLLVQAALIDAAPASTYRIGMELLSNGEVNPRRTEAVIAAGTSPEIPFLVLYRSGVE
ncbi:general secretion pathway protein GspK (plasmid) [Rhizobium sp. TH2]|uniref:general secretion pathway protein GspK n=1 Tax=Rhizobium sp. TH2 TaxID=2775403 RepID=UPI002157D9AC|nr:general secretion pathway protein GspK [Rhizobium sp. TH2]UVC12607.1 general secretion pathway protein GspK [Rhizobium sp. TH2]